MNQSDRDKIAVEGIRMEHAAKVWQNTSKSTRDYIKNWGRSDERVKKTKSFECYFSGLYIGRVDVQWSDNRQDWVWLASMNFGNATQHNTCISETESTDWVTKSYLSTMKCMKFGEWLQAMCKRHEMTTAGLAERLGITRQTVHYWVKGERHLSDLYIYNQIAALFADLEQMKHSQMLGHMSLLFKPN